MKKLSGEKKLVIVSEVCLMLIYFINIALTIIFGATKVSNISAWSIAIWLTACNLFLQLRLINLNEANSLLHEIIYSASIQINETKVDAKIEVLEEMNNILTDSIIDVTREENDVKVLRYMEQVSEKFGNTIQSMIKELEGEDK